MNFRLRSSQDNQYPEPEVKKYPGVVRVFLILVATGVLWSVFALVGSQAPKLLGRPALAASAPHAAPGTPHR